MAFRSSLKGLPLGENHINRQNDYGTRLHVGFETELFENFIKTPAEHGENRMANGNLVMTTDLIATMDLLEADLQSDDAQERKETHGHFISFLDNLKVWFKDKEYKNLSDLEKSVRKRVMGRMIQSTQKEEDKLKPLTLEYTTEGANLGNTTNLEKKYRALWHAN